MEFVGRSKLLRRFEAKVIGLTAAILLLLFLQHDAFETFVAFVQSGEAYQLDEVFFLLWFGGLAALVIAVRRASDLARAMKAREEAEERAMRLARHDPLTGLANRRLLGTLLPEALATAQGAGEECSVLMIDLDHFKPVNDIHGHEMGDRALIQAAERMGAALGEGVVLARVGGDEFVALLRHAPGADEPARRAMNVIRALGSTFQIDDRKIELGSTIGIARFPADSEDPDELIRLADIAMYEAKRAGRGAYRFFHAEMDLRLRERAGLEADLRAAIASGEVTAYFQPVMSLADDRIIGFEALARWQHPTRGLICPDEFIPIAEDLGLIDALSTRILREGCLAARDWPAGTTLSINISPMQLKDSWLPSRLLQVLTETGFAPGRLIVEVTENAVIEDIDRVAELFGSLHAAGIRVALDDFGRGYSSLSHLRQLRFDHLKIDGAFVRTMESPESRKIVRAVAGLGRALGMPVTAEGVETEAAARILRKIGCEQAQGYLFGVPQTADKARRLLARRRPMAKAG